MPTWIRPFIVINWVLWAAVFGAALRGTKGIEFPAGVGFAVAAFGLMIAERVRRRGQPAKRGAGVAAS